MLKKMCKLFKKTNVLNQLTLLSDETGFFFISLIWFTEGPTVQHCSLLNLQRAQVYVGLPDLEKKKAFKH